jgi:hypothetical protein
MKNMELQNFMKNTEPVAQWLTGLSKEDNKTHKKAIMIINMEIDAGLEEGSTDDDRTDAWSSIRSNGKRMLRAEVKNEAGDTFPQASRGQGDKYQADRSLITSCINAMKTGLLALPTELKQILTHAKKPFGKGARDMNGAFNDFSELVGQMAIEMKETLENAIDSNRWNKDDDGNYIVVDGVPSLMPVDRTVVEETTEETTEEPEVQG